MESRLSRGVSSQGTTTKADDFITRIKTDEITGTGTTTGIKYVPTTEEQDSDSDVEEVATDNLLGRLRNGMNVIQNYARETMAQCDTDESRIDMAQRLEKSHLGMLRAEKSFMNTTRIIAEVVDEFASDFEDELEDTTDADTKPKTITETNDQDCSSSLCTHQVSTKKSAIPIVFRPTIANGLSIRNYGSKLSKLMKDRLAKYEDGLTDDVLRSEKKFLELQKQIQSGRIDSENNPRPAEVDVDLSDRGAGDMDELLLCPTTNLRFESDDEEDNDETVLPSTDPITLKPIQTAVRNKFCNHIFDKDSISQFMMTNPTATCPMYGCRNEKLLNEDHFLKESSLTEKIRIKNAKLE